MSKLDIERAFPPDPEIAAEAPAAPEVPAAGVAVKPPRPWVMERRSLA